MGGADVLQQLPGAGAHSRSEGCTFFLFPLNSHSSNYLFDHCPMSTCGAQTHCDLLQGGFTRLQAPPNTSFLWGRGDPQPVVLRTLLRDHSWQNSGDHMGLGGLNPDQCVQGKLGTHYVPTLPHAMWLLTCEGNRVTETGLLAVTF